MTGLSYLIWKSKAIKDRFSEQLWKMRAVQILELDHFASKSEACDLETLRASMSLPFLTVSEDNNKTHVTEILKD